MKRIANLIFLLAILLTAFNSTITAQQVTILSNTEIPANVRDQYRKYATRQLENYYSALLFIVDNEVIKENFKENFFSGASSRYQPEFKKKKSSTDMHLLPESYMMELCKEYSKEESEACTFTVSDITYDEKFYAPDRVSCYIIASYNLSLEHEGKKLFTRECKAYCHFPSAMDFTNVKFLQIEPIRDLKTYDFSYNITGKTINDIYREANKLYENKEYELAFQKYLSLAEQGHRESQSQVSWCYLFGQGTDKNDKKWLSWKIKAASQLHLESFKDVLSLFSMQEKRKEYKKSYEKLAELGDEDAIFIMTQYHLTNGKINKAIDLIRSLADKDNAMAQLMLANIISNTQKDYTTGKIWYEKAAEQGNAMALYCLALIYNNQSNFKKAFEYFHTAAELDLPDALVDCGTCYLTGNGVEKDEKKAFEYYQKGYYHKHISAAYHLGLCYMNGIIVEKNAATAVKYFKEASDGGVGAASYVLSKCYNEGIGVTKDEYESRRLLEKSKQQGFEAVEE